MFIGYDDSEGRRGFSGSDENAGFDEFSASDTEYTGIWTDGADISYDGSSDDYPAYTDGYDEADDVQTDFSRHPSDQQISPRSFSRSKTPSKRNTGKHSGGGHSKQGGTGSFPRASKSASSHGSTLPSSAYFHHNDRSNRPAHRHLDRRRKILILTAAAVVAVIVIVGALKITGAISNDKTVEAGQPVSIEISDGTTLSAISSKLAETGVVDSAQKFTNYVSDKGSESKLKSGRYTFQTGMSYENVLALLISGPNAGKTLTIPEGCTVVETAAIVQDTCGISSDEFIALCHSADTYASEYPFLKGAYGGSLEGYLFPKTYIVPDDATADSVIRMMLSQFQSETAGLDLTYAQSKGLDLDDVVTIASLIEEECLYDQDRAHIAGVLYNRLDQGMKLQLDVTVAYALGGNDGKLVTEDDLNVDSPYNTYLVDGLPAGPISSPGLASMQAACAPLTTDDLYFILTDDYSNFYSNYDDFLVGKEEYEASLQ